MSRRVDIFRTLHGVPAVESNFWVFIPNIETSLVMVEDCTLPFPLYKEITVYDKGSAFYYPGTVDVPGIWSCSFAETAIGLHALEAFNFLTSAQNKDGVFHKRYILIAVTVGSTDIPIPHLLYYLDGAWIQSIQPIPLSSKNATSSMKLKVNFRYDRIVNVPLNALSVDVFNRIGFKKE